MQLCFPARNNSEWGKKKKQWVCVLIRAVLLRDFLDGDADLVAQVPPSVHHAVRPFTQNHLVAVLIGLVDVL